MGSGFRPHDAVILGLDPRICCRRKTHGILSTTPQPPADPRVKPEDDVASMDTPR
jgi:hypothetical protein